MKVTKAQIVIGIIVGLVILGVGILFFPEFSHNTSLHSIIDQSDKIVIKTPPKGGLSPNGEKVLGEIASPSEVKEFLKCFRVKPNSIWYSYYHDCYGDYVFVFYKDNAVLTEVSIGHGEEVRWSGWKSDHKATSACIKYLKDKLQQMNLELEP